MDPVNEKFLADMSVDELALNHINWGLNLTQNLTKKRSDLSERDAKVHERVTQIIQWVNSTF
jgi:hypothetical protein